MPHDPPASCQITLLATSDLHLDLCPWDYYGDRPAPGTGLASVAARLAALRASEPNALLLDNGDFLQGTALGDALAACQRGPGDRPHPMIEAMNLLGYDAVGLGNHDFDYGLSFLRQALSRAEFPVLCANLRLTGGEAPAFGGWALLDREVRDEAGRISPLRIGVLALLPPQVMVWNRSELHDRAAVAGIVETARHEVPRMIAAGADVVVALCHSGIGTLEDGADPAAEDSALALAALPGVDAVIAGHTHQLVPGPEFPAPGWTPRRAVWPASPPACRASARAMSACCA